MKLTTMSLHGPEVFLTTIVNMMTDKYDALETIMTHKKDIKLE